MLVKLLTEHHLEFLSLKAGHTGLHLSKCHNVGNHMLRLNYLLHKQSFAVKYFYLGTGNLSIFKVDKYR